jgi:hypothetical protein
MATTADHERALQIADLLGSRGMSVWLDRKSIAGGLAVLCSSILKGNEFSPVSSKRSAVSAKAGQDSLKPRLSPFSIVDWHIARTMPEAW